MRIPFFIWSALLAVVIYAGFVGVNYLNFGAIEHDLSLAKMIAGIWGGLFVLSLIIGWVRKEAKTKVSDMPDDITRQFDQD